MTVANQLYPLSSPEGRPIPLDVIRAKSLTSFNMTAVSSPLTITIPAGYGLVYLFATKDCILRQDATVLPSALVHGTEYPSTMFIPANMLLTAVVIPGTAQLLGLGIGSLYMVAVEQWAAMNQNIQINVG